jgi:SAM-dependent methyltransferase
LPAPLRALAKQTYARLIAASRMRAYLADAADPRLNIGSGYNVLAGWMNIDIQGSRSGPIYMDATRPFPLPDNAFSAVLCEHMIEHVPETSGRLMVAEALRVLKPGGRVRIITPDLEGLARLVTGPLDDAQKRYLDFVAKLHGRETLAPGDALNLIFYEYGHRHLYSIAKLRGIMEAVGFANVVETRAGHPAHPVFQGAEGHPGFMGLENDAVEAFALEGEKPA